VKDVRSCSTFGTGFRKTTRPSSKCGASSHFHRLSKSMNSEMILRPTHISISSRPLGQAALSATGMPR
jgi:hypothetical protein